MNLSFARRSALYFAAVGVVGVCQGCIPIGAGIAVAVSGGGRSQSASPASPVVTSAAITSGALTPTSPSTRASLSVSRAAAAQRSSVCAARSAR